MVIATLDGFNDMDSVEVFRWQQDEFEVFTETETRAGMGTCVATSAKLVTAFLPPHPADSSSCPIDGRVGRDQACRSVGQRSSENLDANPGVGKLAKAGVGGE